MCDCFVVETYVSQWNFALGYCARQVDDGVGEEAYQRLTSRVGLEVRLQTTNARWAIALFFYFMFFLLLLLLFRFFVSVRRAFVVLNTVLLARCDVPRQGARGSRRCRGKSWDNLALWPTQRGGCPQQAHSPANATQANGSGLLSRRDGHCGRTAPPRPPRPPPKPKPKPPRAHSCRNKDWTRVNLRGVLPLCSPHTSVNPDGDT